jgi:PleD family two-component response regulator
LPERGPVVVDEKSKLLIVEDDLDVADMLNAYFRVQGYDVLTVNWGEDGVRAAQATEPDLIILDIRLPDIDGFEVARRLRTTRKTQDVPIIFLTEKRDRSDRLRGLELGADDYITKPFDVQELRLRVRNALKRASQDSLTNPVTSLPDGEVVDERLNECLKKNDWGLLLISLINIDTFRESYGFVASDDVLRAVSLMVQSAVQDTGSAEDFIGHFGPSDFILAVSQSNLPILEDRIRTRLEQSLEYFYPLKDRDQLPSQANRLSVRIDKFSSADSRFANTEELRAEISRHKN